MSRRALLLVAAAIASDAGAASPDPRLREVSYDPRAVITVAVRRGVVTLIALDPDEAITHVAAGLGGDCSKADSTWCIAAQPGGRDIFVKPKSTARAVNNLAVVTDKRSHAFELVVLADGDPRSPVHRLIIRAPARREAATALREREPSLAIAPVVPTPGHEIVTERLPTAPAVANAEYAIAVGDAADDIVPSLVFDDGRFTYFRFPGNREVPAVFHVLADGSEALVNTRMEDELLVVDRVARRLVLRAGSAAIGVWNEAFDLEGLPPSHGTTVQGVQRVLKAGGSP